MFRWLARYPGSRQRARISRVDAISRSSNGLAVEIANRDGSGVSPEITAVGKSAGGEIARSAVHH